MSSVPFFISINRLSIRNQTRYAWRWTLDKHGQRTNMDISFADAGRTWTPKILSMIFPARYSPLHLYLVYEITHLGGKHQTRFIVLVWHFFFHCIVVFCVFLHLAKHAIFTMQTVAKKFFIFFAWTQILRTIFW